VLVAVVYWPGLGGPFLFDDFPALVNNQRLHVSGLDWSALWRAATSFDPGGTGRQLAMASFALNHALGGLDPWGWKLGGLLVHLLNTVLIYCLCQRLLALAGVRSHLRIGAAGLALLWAVHPLQVSSVLYVVQRMETLCLSFMLMALLAYLKGRQAQMAAGRGWPWLVTCVPLLLLALGCKETALLLPLYTLCLELTLLRFAGATLGQRHFWRWGYGVGCVLAAVLFAAVAIPYYGATENYAIRDFTAAERVLTQLRVLPMYLGQMLLPLPKWMPFYYDDYAASRSLLEPWTTLGGGLLLAGLLVLAWYCRRRTPLLALGILWFFASHAITSNVIALELVFEHRNYFALLGVLLVLAELVRRVPVRDGPGIKIAGVAVLLLGVGALGMIRSATWGERLLLATELTALNPQSPRAAHELAVLYYQMADGSADSPFYQFAVREFERESRLPAATVLAEQSLILMHAGHGLPVKAEWWASLHQRLRDRPITPSTTGALFGLLSSRVNKGVELDDAAIDEAFVLMFNKVVFPPVSYVRVAEHAVKYRNDRALASQLLAMAVKHGEGKPEQLQALAGMLRIEGLPEQADELLVRAGLSAVAETK
jgi:hypothetical protein